jgi:undecaprenyl-diphosphatase
VKQSSEFVFSLSQWLLAFAFLPFLPWKVQAQNREVDCLIWFQQNRTPALNIASTQVANSAYLISLGFPLGYLGKALATKDSIRWSRGLSICAGSALTLGLTLGLKYSIQRPRPYNRHVSILRQGPASDPWAFPSAHTSAAFVTATHLAIENRKWYVVVPAYTWASAVGVSRMYNGYHYPSDVLAGAVLGTGSAWLSYRLNQWLNRKTPLRHFQMRRKT